MISVYPDDKERYRVHITKRYASSIYFLLLNRISYDYSPEELSFLLGQEDDFVGQLERLQLSIGNLELRVYLSWIFAGRNFLFESYDDVEYEFELVIWIEDGIRYYQMDYFINAVESLSFFRLMENLNIKRIEDAERSNSFERGVCQTFFEAILPTDYFKKPRTAREIKDYLDCHLEDYKIPVIYLKKELDLLWGRKGVAPLKRSKAKSYGYRYSLHR